MMHRGYAIILLSINEPADEEGCCNGNCSTNEDYAQCLKLDFFGS